MNVNGATLPVLVIIFVCSAVPGRAETAEIAAAVEGSATGSSRCQSREWVPMRVLLLPRQDTAGWVVQGHSGALGGFSQLIGFHLLRPSNYTDLWSCCDRAYLMLKLSPFVLIWHWAPQPEERFTHLQFLKWPMQCRQGWSCTIKVTYHSYSVCVSKNVLLIQHK